MAHPTTGTRFVALSAAVALGFGGAMIAGPAAAAPSAQATSAEAVTAAGSAAMAANDSVAAVGHDADGNVVVQVEAGSDFSHGSDGYPAISSYADSIGADDVVVQEIGGGYTATVPTADAKETAPEAAAANTTDIVGGAGYHIDIEGDGPTGSIGLCSVGFPATGPNGEDAIITAGHCTAGETGMNIYPEAPSSAEALTGDVNTTAPLTDKVIGEFTHSQFGPANEISEDLKPADAQDFAVITVDESAGYNLLPQVSNWNLDEAAGDDIVSDSNDITGMHDVTTEDIGTEVWRSGRTTGKASGPIGYDGETVGIVDGVAKIADADGVEHVVYGFASETEAAPGDSGGAVVMGDKAVGVVSGGAPAGEQGPAFLWTAELAEGLTHLPGDYEIKTSGEDDETESPEPTPTETPSETPTQEPTEDPTTPAPTPTETDDADVDAELSVDPQEIAAERFLAEDEEQAESDDRGVKYTVEGVEPGSEVLFETFTGSDAASANAGSEEAPAEESDQEPAKSITVTANEDGVAQSRIWGMTTADAEAYIGDYDVVAQTEDETLEGSFSVVAGEGDEGEGGEDGDEGEGGEDLPRTGSTVAPLAAGAAGLVALGGALVYVARRRQA